MRLDSKRYSNRRDNQEWTIKRHW